MNPITTKSGTMRFVASHDYYSVYTTADGEEVLLAHGTARPLVPLEDLDLADLWRKQIDGYMQYQWPRFLSAFIEKLKGLTHEWDRAEMCMVCFMVHDRYEMSQERDGNWVCESDFDGLHPCERCDRRAIEVAWTVNDEAVCTSCRDGYYMYCDDCENYYRSDGDHMSEHDRSGCCESPAMQFRIRNNGDDPLPNDTRVTVTLPGGTISDEGMNAIGAYLRERYYYVADEERTNYVHLANSIEQSIGREWGGKNGNFTKRLSRHAYKTYGIKVPPEVISHVGNLASDHSQAVNHQIETTRNLNLPREQFAHAGSCWWTEYAESRCAFKTNGGFGIRTFNVHGHVIGRIWVMPLKATEKANGARPSSYTLTPTFETEEPDAFIMFNGYGNLEGFVAARMMGHLSGMTYQKIGFDGSPMYVNNESGYLIAPEEIARTFNRESFLEFSLSEHSDLFHEEQVAKQINAQKEQTNVA